MTAGAQAPITNVSVVFGEGYISYPGVVSNGYYVGPYSGSVTLPGHTPLDVQFNCVDFFHDVSGAQTWTATLTNVGSGTGIGPTDATSTTRLYGNTVINSQTFSALDIYRTAAFLASTYAVPSYSNIAGTIAIQSEIWQATSSFYPQSGSSYYATQTTRTDHYTYTAPKTAAGLAADIVADRNVSTFDYADWWVVTIQGQANKDLKSSPQEFLIRIPGGGGGFTSTPEPGTLTLLGSGLFAVAGAGYRRRRKLAKAAAV
jgi:hypothetical protein